ncbi:hypothetical protein [Shimia biformata]|uniref:hypothetical protein n=1 Tax=Shimia biformata TaxID=1294299 RepID=UPI0019514E7B|nr:hypothetical protein [Shimia biformata]
MLEWLAPNFLYNFAKDVYRKWKGTPPEEIVAVRNKWKPIFEDWLREHHSKGLRKDVIIRDISRVDQYPEIEEKKKGISPWFRVGLVGTYHRGVIVALRYNALIDLGNENFRVYDFEKDDEDTKSNSIKALIAGKIPFENIVEVNFEGDEYYNYPHLYCRFANKKEPYEGVAFFTEGQIFPDSLPYYTELKDYESVRKLSLKHGTKSAFI